jgi:hypothetical protein
MGFYLDKRVMPEVPLIEKVYQAVSVTEAEAARYKESDDRFDARLAEVMTWRIADDTWESVNDFYLLGSPRHPSTIRLPAPIPRLEKGPWVRGRRYVGLDRLRVATSTSELE